MLTGLCGCLQSGERKVDAPIGTLEAADLLPVRPAGEPRHRAPETGRRFREPDHAIGIGSCWTREREVSVDRGQCGMKLGESSGCLGVHTQTIGADQKNPRAPR